MGSQRVGHDGATFTFTTALKGFPGGLVVRICLPMQEMTEMQVQSWGREDPLEEMATHSSILAWKIPRREEPGGLTGHRVAKSQTWLGMYACKQRLNLGRSGSSGHFCQTFVDWEGWLPEVSGQGVQESPRKRVRDSTPRAPGFLSWLCHFLFVWPWTWFLISLCFFFLTYWEQKYVTISNYLVDERELTAVFRFSKVPQPGYLKRSFKIETVVRNWLWKRKYMKRK